MTNCKYCADWIGGNKKDMSFHLSYCEWYTKTERALVLFDSINEAIGNFAIRTTRYIQKTLRNWSKIQNKKFWNCSKCGTKFDLALTQQAETCTVCRLRRVIEN